MALNTLIFGGSGKCARHITKLLSSQGHTVHSVIRNPDVREQYRGYCSILHMDLTAEQQKSDIEQLGGKPIVQSIEDSSVDDMVQTIKSTNATAVLWCAGAGGGNPERTKAVDNEGAIRSMDATAEAGVKRYIIISALDVRDKANASTEPDWYNDADRKRSDGVWKVIKPYMEAKFAADRSLASENGRRKLDYTIVRPGGLTNDPAKGAIEAGKVHLDNQISREDVAAVVVECLKRDDTIGLAFDCVGGETPVAEAVAKVGAEKINTFEGRY